MSRRSLVACMAAILLLWAIFAQASYAAACTSLTIDEGLHIASGYTILRTGDFRLVEEHPPLVKLWLALPLLAVPDLPDPRALSPWEEAAVPTAESLPLLRMAQQLIYPYRPIDRLVIPARMMESLLAVLLGAVVFRWAMDLGNWKSGFLALFLLAFDPNILAHAAVAGTDLGAACLITLTLFLLARFLRAPAVHRLAWSGVALGLALSSKLSAMVLLPIALLLGLLAGPRWRLRALLALLLLAGMTLWAVYGFEVGNAPGVPFPVPAASHIIPWLRLRQHMAGGHSAFLLGENNSRGWWYYFPVAFLLKTPLPTLLLLLARIANCKLQISDCKLQIALLLFPFVYGVSSLFSTLNIGYRHLLPILPFLFIYVAQIANCKLQIGKSANQQFTHYALRITYHALLLCLAACTLRLSPHYLAYFNELAGGPDGGWRYLADSNTDWGQAYKDLARFQRELGLGPVRLSAFIFYDPAIYGVEYEPLTPMRGDTPAVFPSRFNPPPGDYVISATTLDGIPLADPEMYDWFRKREPDARIGHVLFYYHIPPPDPAPAWLAQCITPAVPLSSEAITEGFGRGDLRLIYFDCAQTWLYPDGGASRGWYVLHRDALAPDKRWLAAARLSFEQRRRGGLPPLSVFEWAGESGAPPPSGVAIWAAPIEWPPEQAITAGVVLSPPIALEESLAFQGYDVERMDHGIILTTYWQVRDKPSGPFSLMAHLVDSTGRPVAVGDGLGIPWEQLQAGDILRQRHLLPAGAEFPDGDYWLQTGAYWLETMARMPAAVEGGAVGDRLLLTRIELP